jgi:hypothetical protein
MMEYRVVESLLFDECRLIIFLEVVKLPNKLGRNNRAMKVCIHKKPDTGSASSCSTTFAIPSFHSVRVC